jgi:DNA-binding LytR/AlgR family response regulator
MEPMQNIKAIIADGDAHFVAHLESMLSRLWPGVIICGRAGSGLEAVQLIKTHKPHSVFLDVRLAETCGMQVARKFAGSCAIVFITAYDHYAVNAFDSGAVDYLVKPVEPKRLQKAVNRIKKWHLSQAAEHLITGFSNKEQDYLQWIRVQRRDVVLLLSVDEVCYFKAGDKYTLVITKDGESLIKKPIKALARELDPDKFWRIHRSTIVNVAYISKMSRSTTGRGVINLKERADLLTVSRPYLNLFKQM